MSRSGRPPPVKTREREYRVVDNGGIQAARYVAGGERPAGSCMPMRCDAVAEKGMFVGGLGHDKCVEYLSSGGVGIVGVVGRN